MTNIRPISDLRNNFAEISKLVHETDSPVFLTKNGYGDMVVMSIDAYDSLTSNYDVLYKLVEAEKEAESGLPPRTMEDVFANMDKIVGDEEDV